MHICNDVFILKILKTEYIFNSCAKLIERRLILNGKNMGEFGEYSYWTLILSL